MSVLTNSTIYSSDLQTPFVSDLVIITISYQIVVDLSKQCLSWDYYYSLRSSDFVIFIFLELLASARNVFKGVEDRNKISKRLSCSIVSVYDHTKIPQIVLKSDG